MKSLINTSNQSGTNSRLYDFQYSTRNSNSFVESTPNSIISKEEILTPNAISQMSTGQVPELWDVCYDLSNTFNLHKAPYSALQFIPVFQKLQAISQEQIQRFLKNPETRQVLVESDLLKVVLIHWKPGKVSGIHGHPAGGCVFKVLQGKLEELRFTPETKPKLLSANSYRAGSMAYLDDRLGYHQVGNPYGTSAVSLHAYTPGI